MLHFNNITMNTFPFKKLFFATLFATIPFSLLEAFLALFKLVPVDFNNKETYGIAGFLVVIAFMPFIVLMLSGANWLFLNVGYSLYTFFCKAFKIKTQDKKNANFLES